MNMYHSVSFVSFVIILVNSKIINVYVRYSRVKSSFRFHHYFHGFFVSLVSIFGFEHCSLALKALTLAQLQPLIKVSFVEFDSRLHSDHLLSEDHFDAISGHQVIILGSGL